jgi:MFS family permease
VLSGWSALTLQVLWQRVISLESGVDLASATTVVTAFLAGLGVGGLIGGRLADILGPRGSRRGMILVNVTLAAIAWLSVPLIVSASSWIADLDTPVMEFLGYFILLLVPTGLQGTLVSLALRSTASDLDTAPATAGRLTACNAAGAVLGASTAGWYLLGTFGFVVTARIVGVANLLAALVVATMSAASRGQAVAAPVDHHPAADPRGRRARIGWYALYALTGAIALGYEQVFIRVVDIVMRSNSYSFAHVLSLYLAAWAGGAAAGARAVRRATVPRDWFFSLQAGLAISATGALVGLTRILPSTPLGPILRSWFEGNGYTNGFEGIDGPRQWHS